MPVLWSERNHQKARTNIENSMKSVIRHVLKFHPYLQLFTRNSSTPNMCRHGHCMYLSRGKFNSARVLSDRKPVPFLEFENATHSSKYPWIEIHRNTDTWEASRSSASKSQEQLHYSWPLSLFFSRKICYVFLHDSSWAIISGWKLTIRASRFLIFCSDFLWMFLHSVTKFHFFPIPIVANFKVIKVEGEREKNDFRPQPLLCLILRFLQKVMPS